MTLYINSMLSMMFTSTKHPITMIINLMLFTILTSTKSYLIHNNAWYSYTLLLIMIGGMMIIFIYMTTTSPNQKFKTSKVTMAILMIMLITLQNQKTIAWPQNLTINPLTEMSSNITTTMLITYLLITLIIINKTTTHFEGPMRANN